MRVLQVVTDRDRRGAQVYATDLQPGLEAEGCDVTTVALAPGQFNDALEMEALGPSRLSRATLSKLRQTAKDYDVVVAHGSTCLPACAIALVGTGKPFVYRQISDPLFWAASLDRRLRVGLLVRRAAHIVALSDSVADVFAKHYALRRDAVTVIPNAVPGDDFPVTTPDRRSRARASFGIDDRTFVVAYAGALAVEKGVADAIDAMASRPDDVLLIAGAGPEQAQLEQRAAKLERGNVRFLGSLEDVRPLYDASDVIVLPSRGGDSMPAVIIEANLCGIPVIACPIGAIEAVIHHGETGVIVPSNDVAQLATAVAELEADRVALRDMGRKAASRCRSLFTIEATAPSWVSVFHKLTS